MYQCSCGNLATLDDEERGYSSESCTIFSGEPCDACRKIISLNIQITEVRNVLEDLLNQRQELKIKVNELHSPVDGLPLEVTAYIFELYVIDSDPPDDLSSNMYFEIPSPLILGAVCRSWRRISMSTPRLWTKISIQLSGEKAEGQSQLVVNWLNRSGQLPVNIELSNNFDDEWGEKLPTSSFMPLIDAINECSHRWKRLASVELPSAFQYLFCGNSQGAPLLDTLVIRAYLEEYAYPEEDAKFRLYARKPSPRIIEISNIYLRSFDVDFDNVTEITVCQVSFSDMLDIIRFAPLLKKCTWTISDDFEEFEPPNRIPFTHTKLEIFNLDVPAYKEDHQQILDYLTFPALQSFSCNFDGGGQPTNILKSFLERAQCSLLEITLVNVPMNKDNLVDVVKFVPSVQKATIIPAAPFISSNPESFCFALLYDFCGLLLPALSSLYIAVNFTFNWRSISHFVYSDKQSFIVKRPLRNLKIQYHYSENDPSHYICRDDLNSIQQLKDKGIEVVIEGVDSDGDKVSDFIAESMGHLEENDF